MSTNASPTWHFPARAHFASRPDRDALRVDDNAITWGALDDRTKRLAAAWAQESDASDVIALPMARTLDTLLHLIALIRAGREIALLDPLATADERQRAYAAVGATRLADDERLAAIARLADTASDAPRPTEINDAPWSPGRRLLRVLTSGTTGAPKPVPLTTDQVIASTLAGVSMLGSLPDDRWYSPLPWHHVGGVMIVLRALILGFQVELTSHFDAAASLARLRSGETQLASFVPVMLERILDGDDDRDELKSWGTLRALLIGGAATPQHLLDRARAKGLPVARSWGMSESASQIATAPPGVYDGPLPPLPFVQLSEHDGRLVLDGPQILGGRLVTSDRGRISARGVEILGRADDVFISGGENIDPAEVEQALRGHDAVLEALVCGVHDDRWGERPVAFVRLAHPVEEDALKAYLASTLQRFKIPQTIFVVEDIPRNAMGKPDRQRARLLAKTSDPSTPSRSSQNEEQGAKA